MPTFRSKIGSWFGTLAVVVGGTSIAAAQKSAPPPLLQDIKVQRDLPSPATPSATPNSGSLVKKTSDVSAVVPSPISHSPINSTIPVLENTAIPGYSGVLVETIDGDPVVEMGSNQTYNPASNVKIATTYAVLKTFGPEYRFATSVWTDGTWEEATGTIHGNIYFSGRDPVFGFEHAIAMAQELNRMGIRSVTGDVVVTDNFAMNYTTNASSSSRNLYTTLDATKRSAAATRNWQNYLVNSGKLVGSISSPSITIGGKYYVQSMPSNVKLIFSHESAPLKEILKAMMCYSNNFLAERLGDMVGGPFAVSRIVQQNTGVQPAHFYLATSSGLGVNRVTPAAMMKLLRVLRSDLARYRMTFADVMPVAGIDKGTLEGRFDSDFAIGSVVGKTGTLGNTDGGVSALAGEVNTRGGKLLFVIFNQRGSVARFRNFQNLYVATIQGQFGGAASIGYSPISLDYRLSKTKFSYPTGQVMGSE